MSNVTIKQVVEFELEAQRKSTLGEAESLLEDVQHLVRALKEGRIPITSFNINSVHHVTQAHSKLMCLQETLEHITSLESQ